MLRLGVAAATTFKKLPLAAFYSSSATAESICDLPFAKKWNKLPMEEQEVIRRDWRKKMRENDWKSLTIEDKQALYVMAYGTPKYDDPDQSMHVFFGTVAGVALGSFLYYVFRYIMVKPTATESPENKAKQQAWLKENNIDPIHR